MSEVFYEILFFVGIAYAIYRGLKSHAERVQRNEERAKRLEASLRRIDSMSNRSSSVRAGSAFSGDYNYEDPYYDEGLDTVLINEINHDTMDFYGFGDD